jgi:putative transposase
LGNPLLSAHLEGVAQTHAFVGANLGMDETNIEVNGVWKYVYPIFDKQGKTVDFLLTAKRDMAAAKTSLDYAMQTNGDPRRS